LSNKEQPRPYRFTVSFQNAFILLTLIAPWLILVFIIFGTSNNVEWVLPTAASIGFVWALMLGWFLYWRVVSPVETSILCLSQQHNHHYNQQNCNIIYHQSEARFTNINASSPQKSFVRFARSTKHVNQNTNNITHIPVSYRKVDLMFRILARPRSRSADDVLWHKHALALHSAFGGDDEYGSNDIVTSKSRRFKSKFDYAKNENGGGVGGGGGGDVETGHSFSTCYPPRSSIFSPYPPSSPSTSFNTASGGTLFRKSTLELLSRPLAVSHRKPATHFIDGKAHSRMESIDVNIDDNDAVHHNNVIVSSTDNSASTMSVGSIGSWSSKQHTRSASLNLPQREQVFVGRNGFGVSSSSSSSSSLLKLPLSLSKVNNNSVRQSTTTTSVSNGIHGGGIGSFHSMAMSKNGSSTTFSVGGAGVARPPSIEVMIEESKHRDHLGLDFHGILESPCSNHSPGIIVHELTTDSSTSRDESLG